MKRSHNLFEYVFKMKIIVLALMLLSISYTVSAQEKEYLKDGTIEEQINHLTSRSTSWENHKVVLNSWLSNLKKNVLDTLNFAMTEIEQQRGLLTEKEAEVANLKESLQKTTDELNLVQKEKDTFDFIGLKLSKGVFVTTVIILIVILIAAAAGVLWLYKKSFDTIRKTREELETINTEFENYRQESRKKHEQLVVQHHREIQKLKGL